MYKAPDDPSVLAAKTLANSLHSLVFDCKTCYEIQQAGGKTHLPYSFDQTPYSRAEILINAALEYTTQKAYNRSMTTMAMIYGLLPG